MQIIAPSYITDSTLTFCDIPASDTTYPEWDDTYSYVTGQRVGVNYLIDGTTPGVHRIYECTWHGTGNVNLYPPDNLTISGGYIWWTRISATNRWRLFDLIVAPDRTEVAANVHPVVWEIDGPHTKKTVWEITGSSTGPHLGDTVDTIWPSESFASMRVDVTPGEIDSIAVMNADITSMRVIMTNAGVEVYNAEKVSSVVTDYNGVFEDIPSYPNATVSVACRNSAKDLAIGEIIFGKSKSIGNARYGVDVGVVDYSQKDVDAYGNFSILERAYSKKIGVQFTMPVLTHAGTMRLLEKYRSVPLVWIISNLYSTTITYGFYRDLQVSIPNPTIAEGSVNIEGLGADYVHATHYIPPYVPPWDGIIRLTVPGVPTVAMPTWAKAYELKGACTISNGTPCLVTIAGHGLTAGRQIYFATTDTLPAPLVPGTFYFVMWIDVDTFNLSATWDGVTAINTTSAGAGTHTVYGEPLPVSQSLPVAPDTLDVPDVPTTRITPQVFNLIGYCTISQAEPGVVTCNGHGLLEDCEVRFMVSELMTLDTAPGGAGWAVGDMIRGTTSGITCKIATVLTTKTYDVIYRSGTYTSGEILTNETATADQGLGYPTFATGVLPTRTGGGLYPDTTTYYVMYLGANTFNISLTVGGSAIDTTSAGSGTHRLLACFKLKSLDSTVATVATEPAVAEG